MTRMVDYLEECHQEVANQQVDLQEEDSHKVEVDLQEEDFQMVEEVHQEEDHQEGHPEVEEPLRLEMDGIQKALSTSHSTRTSQSYRNVMEHPGRNRRSFMPG